MRDLCIALFIGALNLIAQPLTADSTQKLYSDDLFGVGLCLGKGAGFAGFYYARPISGLGFEIAAGRRIFPVTFINDGTVILFPYMLSGKIQLPADDDRQRKTQIGFELGAMLAEDAGPGGEMSMTMRHRISHNLNLDMNCGIGMFPEQEAYTMGYLTKNLTKNGIIPYWLPSKTSPIFLMWGLGFSFSF